MEKFPTSNKKLAAWVTKMAKMCQPDEIVWIDGSEEEKERLTQEAESIGEVIRLDREKLPGSLYHRTALNDVARTEDLTYICTTLPRIRAMPTGTSKPTHRLPSEEACSALTDRPGSAVSLSSVQLTKKMPSKRTSPVSRPSQR